MQFFSVLLLGVFLIFFFLLALVFNLIWFVIAFTIWCIRVVISIFFFILMLPFIILGYKPKYRSDVFSTRPEWTRLRYRVVRRDRNGRFFNADANSSTNVAGNAAGGGEGASDSPFGSQFGSKTPKAFKDVDFEDIVEPQHAQAGSEKNSEKNVGAGSTPSGSGSNSSWGA